MENQLWRTHKSFIENQITGEVNCLENQTYMGSQSENQQGMIDKPFREKQIKGEVNCLENLTYGSQSAAGDNIYKTENQQSSHKKRGR